MLAKSKFNSIENLISQALNDLNISLEEFTTIFTECQNVAFCLHWFCLTITWNMLVYFIWPCFSLIFMTSVWRIKKKQKKCADVDTPQRKCLQQVRIESKIAAPHLIKLNKSSVSSAVSIKGEYALYRRIIFLVWIQL